MNVAFLYLYGQVNFVVREELFRRTNTTFGTPVQIPNWHVNLLFVHDTELVLGRFKSGSVGFECPMARLRDSRDEVLRVKMRVQARLLKFIAYGNLRHLVVIVIPMDGNVDTIYGMKI